MLYCLSRYVYSVPSGCINLVPVTIISPLLAVSGYCLFSLNVRFPVPPIVPGVHLLTNSFWYFLVPVNSAVLYAPASEPSINAVSISPS